MVDHQKILEQAPSKIRENMHRKNYKKGSHIIQSGEENDSLYFLTNGTAEVVIDTYKGIEQSVKILRAYEVFGELEVFNPSLKTNSIIAKTDCDTIRIHRDYIFEWMKLDPTFSKYLLELIAAFYIDSVSQYERLSTLTIKQRLLVYIYLHKEDGNLSTITKDFLIHEIRAPKRSLNRSIKECIEDGYITYQNKRFHIVDQDALYEYVEPLL